MTEALTVSQEDRDAAAVFYRSVGSRHMADALQDPDGECPHHPLLEVLARHAQQARLAGIRLGLEAAAARVEGKRHSRPYTQSLNTWNEAIVSAATAIRNLDPEAIARDRNTKGQ